MSKAWRNAFIVLVLLIISGFVAWKFGFVRTFRDWWDDYRHVDDDEGNDLPPQDETCSPLMKLGQECNQDDPCCEDETACARSWNYFRWECTYVRPECENILPLNWSMDAYSYEEYGNILDVAEKLPEWYDWLNGNNELETDYAYELEQCMENHDEYVDYCCRCPDGTVARFVYLSEQDQQYMWCFPNPR